MLVLYFVVFIDTVGFGIVLPLQPLFAKQLGASDSVVTLVASSFTGAQLLFAPVWGALSDRIGRRPVLLLTVAGTALGYLWVAFADSLLLLFLARAFGGAMAANIAVAHAYVADLSPPATRARDMARVGAAAGLGFVAGPALGGVLGGPDPTAAAIQIPFLGAAVASAAAFVLALAVLRESHVPAAGSGKGPADANAGRRFGPQLWLLLGLMFATPFVFTGIETTLVLWTSAVLGWGAAQNGVLYAYMGVVALVVQGLCVGPIVAWLGERGAVLAGALAVGAGSAILPLSAGYPGLLAALGAIVFGLGVINPSLSSLVSRHARPDARGRLMGVAQRFSGLGRFAGPAWGGAGFDYLGRDWPSLAGAGVMAAMFLVALRIARPHRDADRENP